MGPFSDPEGIKALTQAIVTMNPLLARKLTPATYGAFMAMVTVRDRAQAEVEDPDYDYAEYVDEMHESSWRLRAHKNYGIQHILAQSDHALPEETIDAVSHWGITEKVQYDDAFGRTINLYKWW